MTGQAQSAAEIRALLDEWLDAIRRKEIDRLMACYADDVVAYDMMPPLEYRGAISYRTAWLQGLSMSGGFEIELRSPVIVAESDVGFAFALANYHVRPSTGEPIDGWFRWTAGLRRIGGRWKIAHEQSSVPIDMDAQQALVDLRP
ncbi:MAG TPA: nuclear transport factor 2 family protein [Enhygromyxa sp.]|nr:nuclear transport factor 2 family protein [Enhygromyxa sp.]